MESRRKGDERIGGTRSGQGRSGSLGDQRRNFSVRLTPCERERVDSAARASGLKAGVWARLALLGALPTNCGNVRATWNTADGSVTIEGTPEAVGRALGLVAPSSG